MAIVEEWFLFYAGMSFGNSLDEFKISPSS